MLLLGHANSQFALLLSSKTLSVFPNYSFEIYKKSVIKAKVRVAQHFKVNPVWKFDATFCSSRDFCMSGNHDLKRKVVFIVNRFKLHVVHEKSDFLKISFL